MVYDGKRDVMFSISVESLGFDAAMSPFVVVVLLF